MRKSFKSVRSLVFILELFREARSCGMKSDPEDAWKGRKALRDNV